jgi:colicin import membrane protein
MPSAFDRIDLAPPRDAGSVRAFGLALLVHALLIAALTWGVNWKRTDKSVPFEAELWSSVPQEAAPKLVEPPPPPPAPPAPPEPAARAPELRTPPLREPELDIALEQQKKRKLLEQKKEAEAERALAKQKAEQQAEEFAKRELAKKEKDLKAKQELAKKEKARELLAAQELAKRKADDAAKKLVAKKQEASEKASAEALAEQRKQNLARITGMAGASGADSAKGAALKSSGPSAAYGAKVVAKVKPNIVFTDDIPNNVSAEVEVRSSPDGTILSQKLVKSSGNKAWDDAVIKAVIRTETMPRDTDGSVPSPMLIKFTPKSG